MSCLELSDESVLVTGKRSRSLSLEQDLLPTFASPQHRPHRRAISVVAAFSADAAMVEDPSAITIYQLIFHSDGESDSSCESSSSSSRRCS